jgi:hypothetical protein
MCVRRVEGSVSVTVMINIDHSAPHLRIVGAVSGATYNHPRIVTDHKAGNVTQKTGTFTVTP